MAAARSRVSWVRSALASSSEGSAVNGASQLDRVGASSARVTGLDADTTISRASPHSLSAARCLPAWSAVYGPAAESAQTTQRSRVWVVVATGAYPGSMAGPVAQ